MGNCNDIFLCKTQKWGRWGLIWLPGAATVCSALRPCPVAKMDGKAGSWGQDALHIVYLTCLTAWGGVAKGWQGMVGNGRWRGVWKLAENSGSNKRWTTESSGYPVFSSHDSQLFEAKGQKLASAPSI